MFGERGSRDVRILKQLQLITEDLATTLLKWMRVDKQVAKQYEYAM